MDRGSSRAAAFTRVGASLIAILSCVSLLSCAHNAPVVAQAPAPPPPEVTWPTHGWPTATPESQGVDSTILAAAIGQIEARHIPVNSLLIERHGNIVLDSYFYPFADHHTHNVYSVTKSVTSMLVGIAMADHHLNDLNAPVYSLLPVQTSDDPRKAHITLANLLSMTSGLDCRSAGGASLLQQMLKSQHLAAYMLSRPSDAEPGSVFDYCGGNSEVVSAVLTQTTGTSALDLARQELFAPLGITHVSWPTDGDGVSHGWGDLELEPRDMAKLGYLWLHNGKWEGRQVIPADYLAQALTRHISVQPGVDYGYGMWLYPGHTPVDFEANGTGGQRITVIPSLDMVMVTTGSNLDANAVSELLNGAVKSYEALPPNPEGDARLASLSADVAEGPAVPERTPAQGYVPVPRAKPVTAPRSFPGTVLVDGSSLPIPRPKPVVPSSRPAVMMVDTAVMPVPHPKPGIVHPKASVAGEKPGAPKAAAAAGLAVTPVQPGASVAVAAKS